MGLLRRRRRQRQLRKLRDNLRALGYPIDDYTDDEIERGVVRFGELAEAVKLSTPEVARALEAMATAAPAPDPGTTLGADDVAHLREQLEDLASIGKKAPGSHEDAGPGFVKLRGGPMDDYLVKPGAPALSPYWRKDGRYEPAGQDEDGVDVADWTPA